MRKRRHDLSHERLFTCDIGELIPCGLVEVVPGDEFRANSAVMARMSPLAAPVMHGLTMRVHHFFVPHRLSWPENHSSSFEDFITGGPDGNDQSVVPVMPTTGTEGDLMDYLGAPVGPAATGVSVSSLPVRAANLCFNEWYRDQDLVAVRSLEDTTVPLVSYGRDYYNTARPWPQKGPEVTLPLGTNAPVRGLGTSNNTSPYTNVDQQAYETGGSGPDTYDNAFNISTGTGNNLFAEEDPNNPGYPAIFADLTNATAATINSLRRASALQRFAENRARFGSRYAEYVRFGFGARPLDSRLQRPEFIGGGSQRLGISEVLQTAPESTPRFGVGDMYGHGVGLTRSNRYRVRFQEHGYVISMFSVRPVPVYSNGFERHWLKQDREDFFQPELAYVGQQEVLEQEIYADISNKDAVFGWNDRYHEYRVARNGVSGEFRSTLDYWHLARQFSSAPALNQAFIEVNPADTKRIFNEQTQDSLWVKAQHTIQARRVVPRNATARLL